MDENRLAHGVFAVRDGWNNQGRAPVSKSKAVHTTAVLLLVLAVFPTIRNPVKNQKEKGALRTSTAHPEICDQRPGSRTTGARVTALRHFVENLCTVWLVNFFPGSRTVVGNAGLFGESG